MMRILDYNQLQSMPTYKSSYRLLLFVILSLLLVDAASKKYSSSIGIPHFRREGGWLFLDRMHLDPGKLRLQFQIKFSAGNIKQNSLYQMELVAIPNQVWQLSIDKKCDRDKFTEEEGKRILNAEFVIHADLYNDNGHSFDTTSTLQIPTQDTYHFVLRHCSKTLIAHGYGRDAKLDIMLDVQNNDRYHSSTESAYEWLLPLLITIGGVMLYSLYKNKEQDGDNWIKWTLKLSLWISITSIVFKYIGFLIYAYVNGSQYQFFDFMFLLFHSASDSAIIVILLLLAYGWTVTFKNSMDFDLYVPLACMLGMVNVIMTMLNKVTDGDPQKHHMYDTIPAYIMIGFRLLGFLIFLGGVVKVSLNTKPDETTVRRYVLELSILGTLYLTFLPAFIYFVEYVDAKYRKEVMYIVIQIVRYVLNLWLIVLSGWKSSTYRKIIDKSFMEKGEKYF